MENNQDIHQSKKNEQIKAYLYCELLADRSVWYYYMEGPALNLPIFNYDHISKKYQFFNFNISNLEEYIKGKIIHDSTPLLII